MKELLLPKLDLFIEADYSQLEIVMLAQLSKDPQLIQDLTEGRDLHTIRASEWLGKPEARITPEERTAAKRISFQLQYGASVNGIARENKISKTAARIFINSYYKRYPQVKVWQDEVFRSVTLNREISTFRTKSGLPAGKSFIIMPTSRRLGFIEKDTWTKGKTDFYHPNVKNYPVQSLATGDIVPLAVTFVTKALLNHGFTSHVVNTVHDSILIDCAKEEVEGVKLTFQAEMEYKVELYLSENYGIKLEVPLKIDFKQGKTYELNG